MDKVYFAKLKETAIIPSKRDEDAGYDIYPNFEEDYIVIHPHETVKIPTGIISAFDKKYVGILKERGSTGTKGIAQRSGIFDSGYRGEWIVPITNTNTVDIVIMKKKTPIMFNESCIIYPYEKAICQALFLELPELQPEEKSIEDMLNMKSERMDGKLGSSNK